MIFFVIVSKIYNGNNINRNISILQKQKKCLVPDLPTLVEIDMEQILELEEFQCNISS